MSGARADDFPGFKPGGYERKLPSVGRIIDFATVIGADQPLEAITDETM